VPDGCVSLGDKAGIRKLTLRLADVNAKLAKKLAENAHRIKGKMTVAFHIYSKVLSTRELSDMVGLEPESVWSSGPRSEHSALANLAAICFEVEVPDPNPVLLSEAVEALLFVKLRTVRSNLFLLLKRLRDEQEPIPPRLWISGRSNRAQTFAITLSVEVLRELAALGCEFDLEDYG
jgi:hypothetical protein